MLEFTVHVKGDQCMRAINQTIKERSLMLP